MDTEQFNIRVSKSLLFDLEFIERATGHSKNDWVRFKLNELIKETKEDLLTKLEKNFVKGRTTMGDFKEIMGSYPNSELCARKEAYSRKTTPSGTHKKFAAKALQTINEISKR